MLAIALGIAVIVAGSLYGVLRYRELFGQKIVLEGNVVVLEHDVSELEEVLASVRADLERSREENRSLAQAFDAERQALDAERSKNQVFEAQIKDISGTVSVLQKRATTDPELLKKYSKVYFLSENYAPEQLSSIGSSYVFNLKKPQLIHSGVLPYLQALLVAAEQSGAQLRVISGYRSFYEQAGIKSTYTVTYGSGANQFSADQGYSEHQLGTAVDFTTTVLGDNFSKFEASDGYKWLTQNAYKYGFILSYPRGNQYYLFEPWHWRFVGVALAMRLYNTGEYFYNLAQRELDEYLVKIFD